MSKRARCSSRCDGQLETQSYEYITTCDKHWVLDMWKHSPTLAFYQSSMDIAISILLRSYWCLIPRIYHDQLKPCNQTFLLQELLKRYLLTIKRCSNHFFCQPKSPLFLVLKWYSPNNKKIVADPADPHSFIFFHFHTHQTAQIPFCQTMHTLYSGLSESRTS